MDKSVAKCLLEQDKGACLRSGMTPSGKRSIAQLLAAGKLHDISTIVRAGRGWFRLEPLAGFQPYRQYTVRSLRGHRDPVVMPPLPCGSDGCDLPATRTAVCNETCYEFTTDAPLSRTADDPITMTVDRPLLDTYPGGECASTTITMSQAVHVHFPLSYAPYRDALTYRFAWQDAQRAPVATRAAHEGELRFWQPSGDIENDSHLPISVRQFSSECSMQRQLKKRTKLTLYFGMLEMKDAYVISNIILDIAPGTGKGCSLPELLDNIPTTQGYCRFA